MASTPDCSTRANPHFKAPSGSRTHTSAMARRQATATSWARTRFIHTVGPGGLEPPPAGLKGPDAAANTLIPSSPSTQPAGAFDPGRRASRVRSGSQPVSPSARKLSARPTTVDCIQWIAWRGRMITVRRRALAEGSRVSSIRSRFSQLQGLQVIPRSRANSANLGQPRANSSQAAESRHQRERGTHSGATRDAPRGEGDRIAGARSSPSPSANLAGRREGVFAPLNGHPRRSSRTTAPRLRTRTLP